MKTRNFILIVAGILCSLSLFSQVTTQQRSVPSFTKISVASDIDVIYAENNNRSVKVEAHTDIIDKIETNVENGELIIKLKKDKKNQPFRKSHMMNVYVSAPILEQISAAGGSDFSANEINSKNDIKISASGGADIEIDNITANQILINVSGGADVEIKSLKAKDCQINASGGADADIKLQTTSVNAKASGGADITLKGKTGNINANSSGAGDIKIQELSYDTITSNTSSGGKIKK